MSQPTTSPVTGTIQELRQAKTLVEQVTASLKTQKKILEQRGLNLPPMVLTALSAVRSDLGKLETALVEEQTELGQLRALADMAAEITTSLEVQKVLEETMDLVIALTRAERGYVVSLDEATNEFIFRFSRDNTLKPGQAQSGTTPKISQSVLRKVIETREPILTDNASNDDRFEGNVSIVNLSLRSVLCVPLIFKEETLGAVYVDNRLQAGIFTEREKNTLMAFANTAAVALANAQMYQEVQRALNEITQTKQLMDNVFDSIGSGLIATNAADEITTFNRAAETILEVPATEVEGKQLRDVLPRIAVDLKDHLAHIRQHHDDQDTIDSILTRKDGTSRAVSFKLAPLRGSDNQTDGVAVVADDVTDKREREQQLRIMKTYLPPELVDKIGDISQLSLGGGEKREITCLFVEVYALKKLKNVRPREVMEILNTYLSVVTGCIHDTQGVIDKYMGNEIMAIWNTQLNPQKDHAYLAVEAALRMRENFIKMYTDLNMNIDEPLYRIGMHTGVATLGNVGSPNRRDFTAIGDTINLSKRLEENSKYGEIILSIDTLQQFQNNTKEHLSAYRFQERPAILGKGKSEATQVYEVFRNNG
ncbi:MAG: adenylate/guanylate cyclase domain-containing protein [Anaerolineae bacterium]|nr:adenylate/guanylate cyclase domain-containing protein [Anaerolineae bacterium]